ncbi:SNF2-related protein [Streptomyces decoyicus]|uniref:SNF2-related protein n=1 Tax=Streptomyces decoyicus TaxID=249567 RepID=UPI0033AE461F
MPTPGHHDLDAQVTSIPSPRRWSHWRRRARRCRPDSARLTARTLVVGEWWSWRTKPGTPVENHLEELWALLNLVAPQLFGHKTQFRRRLSGRSRTVPSPPLPDCAGQSSRLC